MPCAARSQFESYAVILDGLGKLDGADADSVVIIQREREFL
jgi:hypothetical protein